MRKRKQRGSAISGVTEASGYRGASLTLPRMLFLSNRKDDTKGKGSRKGALLKIAYRMISHNDGIFYTENYVLLH